MSQLRVEGMNESKVRHDYVISWILNVRHPFSHTDKTSPQATHARGPMPMKNVCMFEVRESQEGI
jgi:hypothetical protein